MTSQAILDEILCEAINETRDSANFIAVCLQEYIKLAIQKGEARREFDYDAFMARVAEDIWANALSSIKAAC